MPRVLMVEDDALQRRMYRDALASEYDVTLLPNGHDAMLEDWPSYDCVVVDLFMAGLAGDEVIERAAAHYGDRLPPVILFTASPKSLTSGLHLPATVITKGGGSSGKVLDTLRNGIAYAIAHHSA